MGVRAPVSAGLVAGCLLVMLSVTACSLLTELDGLADSPAPLDAVREAGAAGDDGSPATKVDGAHEAQAPFDAMAFPSLEAGADADAAALTSFSDDFGRADGNALGNGWLESNPDALSIAGGRVEKLASATGYRDNIARRPAAEDVLDVEVKVTIRLSGAPGRFQLWARAQNIGPNTVDGYHIYCDASASHFHLARHAGAVSTEVGYFDASEPLNTTDDFRLLLRVTGTSPVVVYASLEQRTAGNWVKTAETGFFDIGAERIATKGAVGFSGDVESGYTFDDFSRVGF